MAVLGVVGHSAEIPCEATPFTPTDEPMLVLWYRDIFGTPIYRCRHTPLIPSQPLKMAFSCSFDMRDDLRGRHWIDRRELGHRATFHIDKTGRKTKDGVEVLRAYLRIKEVRV